MLTIDPTNYKRPVYSKMWVDRLYKAVCRNFTAPFDFYCFTNDLDPDDTDYKIIRLKHNAWGWWNKFEMFKQNFFDGPCLYLDIDNIICKDISQDILNINTDKLLLPREPYKNILNCSTMYWKGDFSFLYNAYINEKDYIIKKYQYATESQPATGDQGFLADKYSHCISALDDFVPDGFIGWKHHKVKTKIMDPSLLIFTSSEKPSNNMNLDIVKKNWID